MPLDTLKASKRLQEGGTFSAAQAERLAEVLSETDAASATKEDLESTEIALRQDSAALREDMQAMEASLREDMQAMEASLQGEIKEMEGRLRHHVLETENRLEQRIETEAANRRSEQYQLAATIIIATSALVTLLNYLMG